MKEYDAFTIICCNVLANPLIRLQYEVMNGALNSFKLRDLCPS